MLEVEEWTVLESPEYIQANRDASVSIIVYISIIWTHLNIFRIRKHILNMPTIYLIFAIQCIINYMTQTGHKSILLGRRMVIQVYVPLKVILNYLLHPLLPHPKKIDYKIRFHNNKAFGCSKPSWMCVTKRIYIYFWAYNHPLDEWFWSHIILVPFLFLLSNNDHLISFSKGEWTHFTVF